MKPLQVYLIFLFLIQCQWLKGRINKDVNISKFDRRLIWEEGRFADCEKNFKLSRIKIAPYSNDSKFFLLAESLNCSLFFQIERNQDHYTCRKIFLHSSSQNKIFRNINSDIQIADTGWGYRLSWIFKEKSDQIYRFNLFMKSGLENDL